MKKLRKILTVILALTFLLPALALIGCTDDKDKQRSLDRAEQQVVGTWKNGQSIAPNIYTFFDDGTCQKHGTNVRNEFRHTGDGIETDGEARGHYEIIAIIYSDNTSTKFALFDVHPDKLIGFHYEGYLLATDSTSTLIRQ